MRMNFDGFLNGDFLYFQRSLCVVKDIYLKVKFMYLKYREITKD